MKKIILFVLLTLLFVSCTNPDEAKRVLEASGFTHIQITGYSIGGCAEDDFYHTGFIAIGQNGQAVEGVVCSGLFKGSTIRF